VGSFSIRLGHKNKIKIEYDPERATEELTNEAPRVYLFVVSGVIKKIGGSAAKKGIKGTLGPYLNAMTGSPGPNRYAIHMLVHAALESGKKVELWMISSPKVPATIFGLSQKKKVQIASFKEMEQLCKEEYRQVKGDYPEWNFQERNTPIPTTFAQGHNKLQAKRINNL
jgi:hypothetical protein